MTVTTIPAWVDDPASLLRHATRLCLAHHLPGRVRLKLVDGGADAPPLAEIQTFLAALKSCPGIASAEINLLARSCLVLYDTKVIRPSAWSDLVEGRDSPELLALLRAVAAQARGTT